MKNIKRCLMLVILCMLSVITISCAANPQVPSQENTVLSEDIKVLSQDSKAQIYAAVIKQVYYDYGDHGGPSVAYIMMYTTDSIEGTVSTASNSSVLSESLQKNIVTVLDDTRRTYIWVSQIGEISRDEILSGEACQIILGNIRLQQDNSTQVTASLYFGGTGGGGTTYVLELKDNVWVVTGQTGPRWIS